MENFGIAAFMAGTGIMITKTNTLPVEETVRVCDIKTKKEFSLLTGKMIHCITIDNKMIVSEEMYQKLNKL